MLADIFGINPVVMTFVVIGLVLMGVMMFVAARYKRCPSNRILVVYGKVGGESAAKCMHGGGIFRLAAHPGLHLPLARADHHRDRSDQRPVEEEHPRERAFHVHDRHLHRAGHHANAAERSARAGRTRDRRPGRDIILGQMRLVIATLTHRGDQPGPREVPRPDQQECRIRVEQDRPGSDQREHP
jgi:flotillin